MASVRWWQFCACMSGLVNILLIGSLFIGRTASVRAGLERVSLVDPGEGRHRAIVLHFATPMDTDAALPDEWPVTSSPPLTGSLLWDDPQTAVILPHDDLLPGVEYEVTPRPALLDQDGRRLAGGTLRVCIEGLSLLRAGEPVIVSRHRGRVTLEFSAAVLPQALLGHLRLSNGEGAVLPVTCKATQPTRVPEVEFDCPEGLDHLRVTVTPGLTAAAGGEALAREVRIERSLSAAPRLHGLGSQSTDDGVVLVVQANQPINDGAAAPFIEIVPPVAFEIDEPAYGFSRDGCWLRGAFQPRQYYRVTFRKGLPGTVGYRTLERDVTLGVVTCDLEPLVALDTPGNAGTILPSHRQPSLPARFRNAPTVTARAYRVYPNNLVEWSRGYHADWRWDHAHRAHSYGHFVGKVLLEPDLPENQSGVLNIPLAPLLQDHRHGLFAISLQARGRQGYSADCQTLLLTDIGLGATCAPGSLAAWTMSLKTGAPLADTELEVLSEKNQRLARGVTGPDGGARLRLPEGPAEETTPYLLVARRQDDLAYLRVDPETARDLTPLQIAGRDLPQGPYEAMVSTDRGIARPGETVTVTVLVRDAALNAVPDLPTEVRLRDSRGRVLDRRLAPTSADGLLVQSLPMPLNGLAGRFLVEAGQPGEQGPQWGAAPLWVGAYRPDRVRTVLGLDREAYQAGETINARVQAEFYYGRPVAGAPVRFRVRLTDGPFAPEGFGEYCFGDDERPAANLAPLFAETVTEADGTAAVEFDLPSGGTPRAALRASVSASLTVPDGETVTASREVPFHLVPYYLGLRLIPAAETVATPGVRALDWVCLNPDAARRSPAADLRWELLAVDWEYVLRLGRDERYVRDWQRTFRPLAAGRAEPRPGESAGRLTLACPTPGLYACRLTGENGRVQTTLVFWHQAGDGAVARLASPRILPLTTDQPAYRPGETATLTCTSPGAGQAVIAILSRTVETLMTVPVQPGENRLPVRLPQTPLGTVWVAVTLITPGGGTATEACDRQFGLAALALRQDDRRLDVALQAAPLARPGAPLEVRLEVARGATPAAASVHLLAVDLGVLALTAHPVPDPFAFFHGARRCPGRFADLYGDILEDSAERYGTVSTVGGDGLAGFIPTLRPEDVRHAVVLSREIAVDASGRATITLPIPDVTGALRLTAVAASPTAVGSAVREIPVRAPLTLLTSTPPPVAPGDRFRIATLITVEDPAVRTADAILEVTGPGRLVPDSQATQSVALEPGRGGLAAWTCQTDPDQAGTLTLTVRVAAGEWTRTSRDTVRVRPVALPIYRSQQRRLEPGETLALKPATDLVPGTVTASAQVAANHQVETAAALAWLQGYPYGCLEQSLSRAMACVAAPTLFPSPPETGALAEAWRLLASVELPAGGFSMWPGSSELWLSGSLYAAHFLVEAERLGAGPDPDLRRRTVAFLRDVVLGRAAKATIPPGERAHALYLLAAAAATEVEVARALAAGPQEPPLVRLLAAAALVRAGRGGEAMPWLEEALAADLAQGEVGGDFDSDVRRWGLALCILNDILPEHPAAERLAGLLRRTAREGHWGTTQNNAMAVLALGRRPVPAATGTAVVHRLPDRTDRVRGTDLLTLSDAELQAGVTITAEQGPVYVSWQERGIPAAVPLTDSAHGLTVRRELLSLDGAPLTSVRHGDLIGVRLTVQSEQPRTNLVVADLVPGGLAIEDASLATRQQAGGGPSSGWRVKTVQKLDDRIVLCADLWQRQPVTYTYHARAVTRGVFRLPRVRAEMMYEPEIAAESGGPGELVIE